MEKVCFEQNVYALNTLQNKEVWKLLKKCHKKKVRKLSRPYFETKVVKVKKKRELRINPRGAGKSTEYYCNFKTPVLERIQINAKRELERRKEIPKEKDNWVNRENLDKIRFPCFCRFSDPILHDKRYGMLINAQYNKGYLLIEISNQSYGVHFRDRTLSLVDMIKCWDIHILKGKIIIYEEE